MEFALGHFYIKMASQTYAILVTRITNLALPNFAQYFKICIFGWSDIRSRFAALQRSQQTSGQT